MNLKECYRILDLPKSADLDEIKKAYRRLAFELHPDLNPNTPDAGRRFQEVNEAYVLLTRTLQAESKRDPRVQHRRQTSSKPEPASKEKAAPKGAKPQTGQAAAQKTTRAQATPQPEAPPQPKPERSTPEGVFWTRKGTPKGSPHKFTGSTGPAAGKPKPESAKAGPFAQGAPRPGQYGPASPGTENDHFDSMSGRIFSGSDATAKTAHAGQTPPSGNAYAKQEEVLGEILNDPFARRVFEDIYSQVKQGRPAGEVKPAKVKKPPKKKKLSLEWGKRRVSVDLTHGFTGAVRGWLRRQLDQDQVLELPRINIIPGTCIRLRVGGMFSDTQQVDVRLPSDYQPGAPIRLKGLGRKLGPWRGDLYLRVVPKEDNKG